MYIHTHLLRTSGDKTQKKLLWTEQRIRGVKLTYDEELLIVIKYY
jgi:hypothetical protein